MNNDDDFAAFNSLIELSSNLRAGDTDAISQSTIGEINRAKDRLVAVWAEVGAKVNRLEMTQSQLSSADINFSNLLSKTEDLDIAEATVYLKAQGSSLSGSLGYWSPYHAADANRLLTLILEALIVSKAARMFYSIVQEKWYLGKVLKINSRRLKQCNG